MEYANFLRDKLITSTSSGFVVDRVNEILFDFQRDIVRWVLQKGKAAVFAGTGLGKTLIEMESASKMSEYTGKPVLIVAPLSVGKQTVSLGAMFGYEVNLCRTQDDVKSGINITNYDMLKHFDPDKFGGIILDESSILKSDHGATRNLIIDMFGEVPFRLACTATPAPNDHVELGNHAEFLGVCSSTEMLAMFFVHDGGDTSKWRLKGHAKVKFWEWVASWAVMLTKPSDLGYADDQFNLPPLCLHSKVVSVANKSKNFLFPMEARTLQERQSARRSSTSSRVDAANDLVDCKEKWLIWCDLNVEQDALKKKFGKNCVSIDGSTSNDDRLAYEEAWRIGDVPILITKPKIFGFGMNWQHCSKMIFVGLSDSFEQVYQAIRRCWRFGQTHQVDVYFVTARTEGAVVRNIERKELEFNKMLKGMIASTQEITKKNLTNTRREILEYLACADMIIPEWLEEVVNG